MYDLTYQENDYTVLPTDIQKYINDQLAILQNESLQAINIYSSRDVLSNIQIATIKKKYEDNVIPFDNAKNMLCELFHFLDYTSNNYSVPPMLVNKYKAFELFGSSINSQKYYCSPYDIDEQCFGSFGDFFKFDMTNGFYIANPPFDLHFIDKTTDRLIGELKKKTRVDVIIVYPNWPDVVKCSRKINDYVMSALVVKKYDIKFYDYFYDRFANVIDCWVVHVANYGTEFELGNFLDDWKKVK